MQNCDVWLHIQVTFDGSVDVALEGQDLVLRIILELGSGSCQGEKN